jgi:broad specificity phosphatase PhoE
MQQTVVYLVRHGEVANPLDLVYGRIRDISLSPEGTASIERLALQIKKTGDTPAAFFVSPRKRTRETATIISRLFAPVPFWEREDLGEVDSRGVVGRSLNWFRSVGDVYDKTVQDQEGFWLETEKSQAERMCSVVTEARNRYPNQTSVLVSHGHPLAFAMDALRHSGLPVRKLAQLKPDWYLLRGQAWRLAFAESGELLDCKTIVN